MGEAVDVWESQSWLETVVQRVKGRGVHVREVPKRSIPLADVRASLLWTGSAWASRDSPGVCWAVECCCDGHHILSDGNSGCSSAHRLVPLRKEM